MLALTLKQFNNLAIDAQVAYVNKALEKLGSLRKVAIDLHINKSTIQSRFKRAGYALKNNHYDKIEQDKSVELSAVVDKKVQTSGKDELYTIATLKVHEDHIFNSLSNIATEFLNIGFQLDFIQTRKLYTKVGYASLTDYAFTVFKMKKTSVYNLISVYRKFSVDGKLKEQYSKFTYSQLVELINAPENVINTAKPSDTVKQIREKKKDTNKQITVDDFTDITTSGIRPNFEMSKYQKPIWDSISELQQIKETYKKDTKLVTKIMDIESKLQEAITNLNKLKEEKQ